MTANHIALGPRPQPFGSRRTRSTPPLRCPLLKRAPFSTFREEGGKRALQAERRVGQAESSLRVDSEQRATRRYHESGTRGEESQLTPTGTQTIMATAITAPATAAVVAEGVREDAAAASVRLHKENAMDNWAKIQALMDNKQVCGFCVTRTPSMPPSCKAVKTRSRFLIVGAAAAAGYSVPMRRRRSIGSFRRSSQHTPPPPTISAHQAF